jgi:hypothetical protein
MQLEISHLYKIFYKDITFKYIYVMLQCPTM